MRIHPPEQRAYTYKVTVPPAELPVSIEEAKAQLKINHNLEDALLTMYIQTATYFAEKFTRRDIIQRTYVTYRDSFPVPSESEGYYYAGLMPNGSGQGNTGFELRKSPLVSVTSVNYVDLDLAPQVVDPTVYYNTVERDYSEVLLNPDKAWPTDVANRMQAVNIEFVCGLFPDAASVAGDWKNAILQHVTLLYSDRGDCSCDDSGRITGAVPKSSMAFYYTERIINL